MIRIVLLLIIVAAILAFKFLPWYVLVGLAVLFMVFIKFLGKRAFLWLFSLPFRVKGAALRKATVEVHSVELCAAPERPAEATDAGDDEDEFEDDPQVTEETQPKEPRSYYRVDATITPKQSGQRFTHWEIGEVNLALPNYSLMGDTGNDACEVEALEVELDGEFVPNEGYKLMGPRRLRFIIAVKPGVDRLVFHYYFEKFGELVVPASGLKTIDLPSHGAGPTSSA